MEPGLVIFDCDGVLVDSEPIAIATLCRFLADLGVTVSEATAYERFLGRAWPTVRGIIAEEFSRSIGEAEEHALRVLLASRFRADLRPMRGITAVLDRVEKMGWRMCVASSSLPDRLHLSLETTGLLPRFAPHVFSAAEVKRGKPFPDLFLHAATRMDVDPSRCVVVEDSPTGIEAAQRAGMAVVAFLGGGHVGPGRLATRVAELEPDHVAASAGDLARLFASWTSRPLVRA